MGIATNIFQDIPEHLPEELMQDLLRGPSFCLERIVSRGHRTPEGEWLDQDHDEWVLLLSGSAGLRFEGEAAPRVLDPGDYAHIPARARHRVDWTAQAQDTVWLAIHYHAVPPQETA